MTSHALALELKNIVKEFPGVRALDGVCFDVRSGEVHALCGENGAGKSTLMKIISGLYPYGTYQGDVVVKGEVKKFGSIKESQAAGVAIVFQELSLVLELSVAENIFLGREPSVFGVIQWDVIYTRTAKILSDLGFNIQPLDKVGDLGIGQRQMVEIAKALALNAKILILDEPTSALSDTEIEVFLATIRQLRARGVACVLITHKLNEVFSISDRITVFRDGRSIVTYATKDITEHKVIAHMVGRELKDLYPRLERKIGGPVLEVKGLSAPHPTIPGREVLHDVSFSVRKGEILGIAGLMGSGRTEILMSIFGALHGPKTGTVKLEGQNVSFSNPMSAINAGLALVSEDRKRLGLMLDDTVSRNIALASLKRMGRFGLVNDSDETRVAKDYIKSLRIKTPGASSQVKNLSGGNQQKVVLAKWMLTKPKVLFLDEPTRGIDVGARAEIYKIVNEMASEGVAVVMVSSELPEVLGLSDRVIVMCNGRITGEFSRDQATQERIMAAATRFS
ncbi:MAG: sugar ABC transporter ATP-binding protein [Proteobacteria bacterium]|nr:sugar ABC transporter ATP-binding protein [Pseudomonadota bacterium]